MKAKLASLLIRFLALTWRYSAQGERIAEPAVLVFWHGDMLPVWKYFSRQEAAAVTSLSKDGNLLAQLLKDWFYIVLRGSSSRGGKEVLEEMVHHARHRLLLITPDGPRGPAGEFKVGALVCAQRAAVSLYRITIQCSRFRRLEKSWDKFMIPMPFARINVHISEALTIPTDASREEIEMLRQELSAHTAGKETTTKQPLS